MRGDIARYDDWFRSRWRAPGPASGAEQPRRKSRAQAEFDALYDRFLADARANRATARRQGVHPYMTDDAPRIIRQTHELIRTRRLPGMAAETLSDTIVEYKRMRAAAAQAPIPEPAPQAARPPPRELTPDELFQNLRQRCDANREEARAQGIEPYKTGEGRSIHEAAKHLVNRKDAPREALPYIRELFEGYYRWETRQRPRHDPPAQSIRIRY